MGRISRFLGLCLTAALLVSCGGGGGASAPAEDDAVTFSDALGRTVTVSHPRRVAALIGSFADIWCLAGGQDTLVAAADDAWTSFSLGLDDSVANLGKIKQPNLELLVGTQPDLILASSSTAADVELQGVLEDSGLNVAYFKVTDFDDYLSMLDLCTQITGQRDRYRQYGLDLEAQIDAALARADGSAPRVLYIRATGASCKVKNSRDSVLGEMLADLGCVNIADGDAALLEQLSMESILAQDPDYIFLVLQGSDPGPAQETLDRTLRSDPAWQTLTAIQEGRCYVMDNQLFNLKPNARWGEAYETLADILYPAP